METAVQPQNSQTSSQRLKDKVAIITGSAGGIGYVTAELFAKEGAKVVIVDLNQEAIDKASSALGAFGYKCDVSKLEECEALIKATIEKYGKIDILVNNAGITRDNLIMRMQEADWDLVMDVNLKSAWNCIKAVIRPMLKAHYGKIINITSVVGQEGNAGQSNYSASKAGLIGLTKSCAREFASRNINVNAVAPGFIKTRLTDAIPEEAKKKLLEKILLGRMGEPIDVARAILFLASEESNYITGAVLGVNGGGYM
jgi:3-oxoacyl-[acyl-carrier protein] reductase